MSCDIPHNRFQLSAPKVKIMEGKYTTCSSYNEKKVYFSFLFLVQQGHGNVDY